MKQWLLMAILLLVHGAFFYFALTSGTIYTKDSAEYLFQASNLLNRGSWYCGDFNLPVQPELYSQRTPGYGLFIMLVYLLAEKNFLLLLVQSVLSMMNIYICVKLIRMAGGRLQWTLLLPFLFFPTQFIYANMIMSEMLLQTAVMASVYFLLLYLKTFQNRHLLFYQLFLTLAVITKPVMMAFPVISIALLLLIDKRKESKSLYLHIIPVAFIALITLVNGRHTGYFEYSSIARKLAVNYHAYYSSSFNHGKEASLLRTEKINSRCNDEPDYHAKACCEQAAASRMIVANVGAYVLLTAKGVVLFFIDHSRYDLELFAGTQPGEKGMLWHYRQDGLKGLMNYILEYHPMYTFYLFLSVCFNILLVVGFLRFLFSSSADLYIRLIIAAFILYPAFVTGMSGTTRFRMPFFLLIVMANMVICSASILQKPKTASGR